MRKTTSHSELIGLIRWADLNKKEIQDQIDRDGKTVRDFAIDRKVSDNTIRTVFAGAGVTLKTREKAAPKSEEADDDPRITAMLCVMGRICRELNISDVELLPFIK